MLSMETSYLNLLSRVLHNGEVREDRTGTGTISLFGEQIKCDLNDGFPLMTTKQTFMKPIAGELLWFLEGSSDERRLAEITYGTRDLERTTIWSGNSNADYWIPKAKFPGDLGRVYGVQWRKWRNVTVGDYSDHLNHQDGGMSYHGASVVVKEHDQILSIIDKIKNNPTDRRMILTAFNVGELDKMALPPCHMFAQFYVSMKGGKKRLSCQVYIRSNDLFLGLPFNIASYALLTHMIAQVTGCSVGELTITIGDAHIYSNHVDQVKEQLGRTEFKPPFLLLNPEITDIDKFTMGDITVQNYQHHPSIKAPMAV